MKYLRWQRYFSNEAFQCFLCPAVIQIMLDVSGHLRVSAFCKALSRSNFLVSFNEDDISLFFLFIFPNKIYVPYQFLGYNSQNSD